HRRLEGFGRVADVGDEGGLAGEHGVGAPGRKCGGRGGGGQGAGRPPSDRGRRRCQGSQERAFATRDSARVRARIWSYSFLPTGAAPRTPSSSSGTRKVSRAVQAAKAETRVTHSVIVPTTSGTLSDPGGATAAKMAGSIAVIVVP